MSHNRMASIKLSNLPILNNVKNRFK